MTYKDCKYNCGQKIEWNDHYRYYVEESGKRHFCPNFKKTVTKPLAEASQKYESESKQRPSNLDGVINEQVTQGGQIQSINEHLKKHDTDIHDIWHVINEMTTTKASELVKKHEEGIED